MATPSTIGNARTPESFDNSHISPFDNSHISPEIREALAKRSPEIRKA